MLNLPQSGPFSFHSPAVTPESSCSFTRLQSASSFYASLRKKRDVQKWGNMFWSIKNATEISLCTHTLNGRRLCMCVCVLSVTPPRCGDPTHCEPCVRSLYLLPVFQAYIQPKRPKCKQHTNNTEAHEPIVTGYTST